MNRRWLTWILICVMVFSLMAESAFAADSGAVSAADEPEPLPTETVEETPDPTDEPEPTASPEPTATPEPTPSPVPLAGLSLSETALTVRAAETHTLRAVLSPENVSPVPAVKWSSSDAAVAKVDANGAVTGVGLGKAVITAEAEGFSAECKVTVLFQDVADKAYYYDAVYWAVDANVTNGITAAKFGPDSACTRAQVVTFLYRINGSPKSGGSTPFKDVKAGQWFYDAVLWANQAGIVQGTSSTTFSPNESCTRGQIVTMLWRCRKQKAANSTQFQDVAVGSYYDVPVRWATAVGITNGTGAHTFSPNAPCTRAQIVTMLHRSADKGSAIYDRSVWQVPYAKAAAVLDQVGWDLKSAFRWSVGMTYYADGIDISAGSEVLANYGFEHHKGDCYVYAATFYTMAIDLGYDAHQVFGYVPRRGGGKITHSWVEIDIDGATYVFDPDFQYATGKNGFMIHYGMSGTWMYMEYGRIN